MMAGGSNPNWWSMYSPPPSQQQQQPSPSFLIPHPHHHVNLGSSSSSPSLDDHNPKIYQELPQSWSQLLLVELSGDQEERFGLIDHFQPKRLEIWKDEHQHQHQQIQNSSNIVDVKQEVSLSHLQNSTTSLYDGGGHCAPPSWSSFMVTPTSNNSPKSCVTSNILDFSHHNNKAADSNNSSNNNLLHADQQYSSECNSTATTGGAIKKARVQPSSQPPLKIRKEKLGDRITALHQIVSPFGKTDTASVLLESIGYIRFLHSQIEALSSPYMGNSASSTRNQHCEYKQEKAKDLKSRGLCLMPISCTQQVDQNDNGADYWAPAPPPGNGF